MRRPTTIIPATLLLGGLLLGACEDPAAPGPAHLERLLHWSGSLRSVVGDADTTAFDVPFEEGMLGIVVDASNPVTLTVLNRPGSGSVTWFHVPGDGEYGYLLPDVGPGPYRLMATHSGGHSVSFTADAYLVDTRPEEVDVDVAPGDTISGERLEGPVDIDEYNLHVASTTTLRLHLRAFGSARWGFSVRDAQGNVLGVISNVDSGEEGATSALTLQPGTYIIRVNGANGSYDVDREHGYAVDVLVE